MIANIHKFIVAALVACSSLAGPGADAQVTEGATLVAALKGASGELRQVANDAISAEDQVLHNRLEEGAIRLELLIPKAQKLADHAVEAADTALGGVAMDALGILESIHRDIAQVGTYTGAKVNLALAHASAIAAAVPFVNVAPAVFALSPTRIEPSHARAHVRIFGYLPGEVGSDIKVFANDSEVSVLRSSVAVLSFELPAELSVSEERTIRVHIQAVEHYGPFHLLWKTHSFNEIIEVGKKDPYLCTLEEYLPNPEYMMSVRAPGGLPFDATTQGGDNRPNEHKVITAENLFTAAMGESAHLYDLSTVIITDLGAAYAMFGECRGQGPGGRVTITDSGKTAEIDLTAPSLSDRLVSDGFLKWTMCHAGGTHAHVDLHPTFKVAKGISAPLVLAKTSNLRLGVSGTTIGSVVPTPADWSLHIKCSYQELEDHWATRTMILSPTHLQDIAAGVTVRLADRALIIEPFDTAKLN
jgi:hypothetical protein